MKSCPKGKMASTTVLGIRCSTPGRTVTYSIKSKHHILGRQGESSSRVKPGMFEKRLDRMSHMLLWETVLILADTCTLICMKYQ